MRQKIENHYWNERVLHSMLDTNSSILQGADSKHQFFDTTDPKFDQNSPFYFFQTLSIKITA
jgi:hypothetical protein